MGCQIWCGITAIEHPICRIFRILHHILRLEFCETGLCYDTSREVSHYLSLLFFHVVELKEWMYESLFFGQTMRASMIVSRLALV